MFGWIKRRARREHIKLTKQNVLAFEHLLEIQENAIEAGLSERDRFPTIVETNLETSCGHLGDLRKYATLPHMIVSDALSINKDARREYDHVLAGSRSADGQFGTSNERLDPFDQKFTPNEGWQIFIRHFGEAGKAVTK